MSSLIKLKYLYFRKPHLHLNFMAAVRLFKDI